MGPNALAHAGLAVLGRHHPRAIVRAQSTHLAHDPRGCRGAEPIYEGARDYRTNGGPVINIRYRDVAFFSTGEGLGYNILRGDHYNFGVGLAYDLGRKASEDLPNLHGMGVYHRRRSESCTRRSFYRASFR